MRLRDIILEYKRDVTAQRLGHKLSQAGSREGVTDVDKILSELEDMDPTSNKQYMVWLANQYIAGKFRLEDSPRIKEVLVNFGTLKSRLPEKDIGRYDLHTLEDVIDRAMGVELGSSDALTSGTFPIVPDSEILYNGPLGQLAVPKTEEASCELGKGTKWCTAGNTKNTFAEYNSRAPLYIWRDKNGEKYQFHFAARFQFMDRRNQPISNEKLKYFRTQHPKLKKLFVREESKIVKLPGSAYQYAEYVIKGRWPEAEPAIAQSPMLAFQYAYHVIKGRWPKGEAAIAQDPKAALYYVIGVIKGRWPEAEKTIAQDPRTAVQYKEFLQKIKKDSLKESWSKKYKKSINCSNPKGFSQKAHCAGRKARSAGKKAKSSSVSEMQLHEEYSWVIQHKDTNQVIGMFKDQDAAIDQYNSIPPAKRRNYVVKNVPRRHIDPRNL